MAAENMEELLTKSASTDVRVLLAAKENTKRAVLENPSPVNLAAFERASKLVEAAMEATKNFKDYKAVLAYAEDCGRKVKRSKLFSDIAAGLLRKQPDGSLKPRDVDRYFASLPMLATPDAVAEKAADRRRRKEEEEIRKLKAAADKDEFSLAVQKGKFVPRDQVYLELAARAVTLAVGLKSALEARAPELVDAVEGNPKKTARLMELLENILDEAFNEYSRPMEFSVEFVQSEKEVPNAPSEQA